MKYSDEFKAEIEVIKHSVFKSNDALLILNQIFKEFSFTTLCLASRYLNVR